MIADGLTKPLGPITFEKFVGLLGLTNLAGAAQGLKEFFFSKESGL